MYTKKRPVQILTKFVYTRYNKGASMTVPGGEIDEGHTIPQNPYNSKEERNEASRATNNNGSGTGVEICR